MAGIWSFAVKEDVEVVVVDAHSSVARSTPFSFTAPDAAAAAAAFSAAAFSSSGRVQLAKASHILSIITKGPVNEAGGGKDERRRDARGGTGNSPPGTGFVPAGTDRLGLKGT